AIGFGLLTINANPVISWPGLSPQSDPVSIPAPQPFSLQPPSQGEPLEMSRNWAGYVNSSATYTAVQATWRVPTLISNGSLAIWVGVGGAPQRRLLQAGTLTKKTAYGTKTILWIEGLPQPLKPIARNLPDGAPVHIAITHVKAARWNLTLQAGNYRQIFHVRYPLTAKSAEWIVEDPLINNKFAHFPTFHPIELFYAKAQTSTGVTVTAKQSMPIDLRIHGAIDAAPILVSNTTFAVSLPAFRP
ncbi:MAG: hypothetical protein C7B44_08350, partial [Sulfobacillus thermosulfidooxidans]